MIRATFAIPGDLSTPTGGYHYARRLMEAGPAGGLALDHLALPDGFPFPDAEAVDGALAAMRNAPPDRPLLVDGLAYGALPSDGLRRVPAPLAVLLHHPLALETGLAPEGAARLETSERAALGVARAVATPSEPTAAQVSEMFGVPREAITVARPGLDRGPLAARRGDPPVILSVGTLTPRKDHATLIAALGRVVDRPWRAVIVGDATRDPACAAMLREAAAPLGDRVAFPGQLDSAALDDAYAGADLFCLPSRYEGYGMVYAEAMTRGLPLVVARNAAAEALLPPDAALMTPPGDAEALAAALAAVLDDRDRADRMAEAAREAAEAFPGWENTASVIAAMLRRIAP